MADLSLVFDLLAKDRASAEVAKVGDSMKRAGDEGSRMGGLIKTGIGMAAGAIAGAGIVDTLVGFYDAAAESAKVGALTTSVIKSTGQAAGITADQVGDLATALSNKTGQDDEAIQSAENLLLTFTNVRNEAGRGNDVFNQTAALALDMSTALGTDASSAAMQLGKALNDPVKGVTALSKAGVSFTAQQKDQIKSMVASGNLLGAQRIILAEVGKEFGGAAEAAATPMDRMKVAAGNLQEAIGTALIPVFGKVAGGLSDLISGFMDGTDEVGSAQSAWAAAGATIYDVWANKVVPALHTVGDYAQQLFNILFKGDFTTGPLAEDSKTVDTLFKIRDGFIALAGYVQDTVIPAVLDLADKLGPVLSAGLGAAGDAIAFFADHTTTAKVAAGGLLTGLAAFAGIKVTQGIVDQVTETKDKIIDFKDGVLETKDTIVSGFTTMRDGFTAVKTGAQNLAAGWSSAQAAGSSFTGALGTIGGAMRTTVTAIGSGIAAAATWIWQQTAAAATATASAARVVAGWILQGATAVAQGLVVAGVWTAQIVASAVSGAASFGLQVAQVVGGWLLHGATAVAQGLVIAGVWVGQVVASAVTGAISFGIQVAQVVGGWVLMGVQAMLQAARMAAAWFIALGPVGWVIAAVIGLVALIIANWDRVKAFTVAAFHAVVDAVVTAFHWVVDGVSSGISNVISFVSGLPGKIMSALGNLGSLLLTAGGDLLRGLWNGISGAVEWLKSKIGSFFGNLLPGWVKDMLGIHSPSRVFAEFGRSAMQGFAAGLDGGTGGAVDATRRAMSAVSGVGADLPTPAGALGYRAPGYALPDGGLAAATSGATYHTTVSGVASPEQVAAQVVAAQRTNEFLAGVGA
jgi:Prophage tail length tape measure protein